MPCGVSEDVFDPLAHSLSEGYLRHLGLGAFFGGESKQNRGFPSQINQGRAVIGTHDILRRRRRIVVSGVLSRLLMH